MKAKYSSLLIYFHHTESSALLCDSLIHLTVDKYSRPSEQAHDALLSFFNCRIHAQADTTLKTVTASNMEEELQQI